MRSKRPFHSVFLDVEAAADEDEDEEESETDFDDEIDRGDRIVTSVPARSQIEDDEEVDEIFDSLRRRAIARGSRPNVQFPHENPHPTERGPDTTISLPDVEDFPLFSFHVKVRDIASVHVILLTSCLQVGKEFMIVLRLMRKYVDDDGADGIGSIFTVPVSPGRVYLEARSITRALKFLEGFHFVRRSSVFFVPIVERVPLLTFSVPHQRLRIGDHVKIRNGLYKGDEGVLDELASDFIAVVKLKSRYPLSPAPNTKKRKRGHQERPEPHVIKKEDARRRQELDDAEMAENAECLDHGTTFVDLGSNGFMYKGVPYTNDGLILLPFRVDRLEKVPGPVKEAVSLETATWLSHAELRGGVRISDGLLPDASSKFSAGNTVRIRHGECVGMDGRVLSVSNHGMVTLDLTVDQDGSKNHLIFEADARDLERVFKLGEPARVERGEYVGFVGLVSSVGIGRVNIVDITTGTEVR